MSEWKEVRIGDNHIDLISGFAFKSKNFLEYKKEGSLPVIKIKNVANGDVNLEKVVYHQYDDSLEKYKLSFGDVLIAMTGNHPQAITQVVGDVSKYKLKTEALLNQRVGKIITKGKNDLNFFYYFFKDEETHRYLANNSSGSANQANISKNDILGLKSEIPEPPEQKAIAEVLSSLDDKIDLLHRQNKTLEQMAETLFRQWFTPPNPLKGENISGNEKSPLGDLGAKEDWEEYKIGNKLKVLLGGTPSTKKPEYWNGVIPWINSGEINKFRILEPTKYITQLGLDNSSTKLLPKGTTVIAITGATLGQVSRLEIDACANQSVIGIIGSKEFANEYIYLWIKHYIKDIIANQTGGAQQHINTNDVKNTPIIKPDKTIYEKFMNLIKPIFEKISTNSFQIRTLEKMRDTLLPKLMSGEVRVRFEDIKGKTV